MGLVDYAKNELSLISNKNDVFQRQMNTHLLSIIKRFVKQGHSGFSAGYATRCLGQLLHFKPLSPLTGEESEWHEVTDTLDQNKRCGSVFRLNKDNDTAYDIDGEIFSRDQGKTWFTNDQSKHPVTFPYYVPKEPIKTILPLEEKEGEIA